jgi:hypothetical protein
LWFLQTLQCEQHEVVFLLPRRAGELAERGEHALNQPVAVRGASRGNSSESPDLEHVAMLIVCLHQAIAIEEYGLPVPEGCLFLLIGAPRHQSERHTAGA